MSVWDLLGTLGCAALMGIAVIVGAAWLMLPKEEKSAPPAPARNVSGPPPSSTGPSGSYVRRWTLQRRAWVIAEKHQWQAEFDS